MTKAEKVFEAMQGPEPLIKEAEEARAKAVADYIDNELVVTFDGRQYVVKQRRRWTRLLIDRYFCDSAAEAKDRCYKIANRLLPRNEIKLSFDNIKRLS